MINKLYLNYLIKFIIQINCSLSEINNYYLFKIHNYTRN